MHEDVVVRTLDDWFKAHEIESRPEGVRRLMELACYVPITKPLPRIRQANGGRLAAAM